MYPLTGKHFNKHWPRSQKGGVMVLVVIALAAMLLMGALALDGGHMLLNKTRLQNSVDAAALSGAKTLQQSFGAGNASSLARAAALDTLARNAAADGNGELANAVDGAGIGAFAVVELSNSVYGPFSFPGPADATYVRVSVPDFPLAGFLWNFARSFGNGALGEKAVAAIATAGPSPSSQVCKIDPIVVCGNPSQHDPANGNFWGYRFGDMVTLTCGTPGSPSAGNCQLLRLGSMTGGADVREAFCKGIEQCNVVGDTVNTEPGITWGPVAQGLNTRLGIYNGPVSSSSCPPDWYTEYSEPLVTMDGSTPKYQGQTVVSNRGDLSTSSHSLIDINDWMQASANCVGGGCDGVAERRVLNVVIGNCSGVGGGATSVPVLGFGCFYLLQKVNQSGDKEVLGQFLKQCSGDGVAGPVPTDDSGPVIIQLYKTYIDNNRTPSTDS